MEQSHSWEANWFSDSQVPSILWNPKVHYRIHKRTPLVPILSTLIYPLLQILTNGLKVCLFGKVRKFIISAQLIVRGIHRNTI